MTQGKPVEAAASHDDEPTVPFFPDQFMREFWMAIGITALFFVMALLKPIFGLEVGEPADPMVTPEHIKPEWYFLAIYQVLKYVPKTPGAVLPILIVVALMVLPFLNGAPDVDRSGPRRRLAVVVVLALVFAVFTVLGGR